MAYHTEKNGHLVIDGFEQGIAPDPYSGISAMRKVNINTVLKEVSVGFGLTVSTITSGTLGIPIHRATKIIIGQGTENYICDATGQVFKSSSGQESATWATTSAPTTDAGPTNQGMAFLNRGDGYLFRFRESSIDYYNGTVWVTGWNPATGMSGTTGKILPATNHFAFVAPNNVLYFCNGSGIGSISQVAGKYFDPTDPTTYTTAISIAPLTTPANDLNALKLPGYDTAQSITNIGAQLLIGGSLNAIYPWDRVSSSFGNPIFCAENFIRKMVTANTNVFIFPGNISGRGRVYITNGSQCDPWFKFPDYLSGYQEPYYKFYDAIYHRNSLVFGIEATQNGTGAIITSVTSAVWAVDCETKSFRGVSDLPGGSSSARVLIPDLSGGLTPGYGYMTGYSDGSTTNGIAATITAAGTGNGTIISDLIPVGTFLTPKTFSQVEFKLSTPLQSGESIQLTFYTDENDSGTIGTFTSTATSIANNVSVNFEKNQWLRIGVTLTGNSPTSGCRLREIRLIP